VSSRSVDLFLDGHPPMWRFQLQGLDALSAWLRGYSPGGVDTTAVRAVPTDTGFVTELTGRHEEDGVLMTDRKILVCDVRNGRISELTIYCSGDWGPELTRSRRGRDSAATTADLVDADKVRVRPRRRRLRELGAHWTSLGLARAHPRAV
jgi:hypothetical protein